MSKRAKIAVVILTALLLIFFLPVPRGSLDDGGTRIYAALTYKIVVWNKLIQAEENGRTEIVQYRRTSIFWYPDNDNLPGELWKLETARHPDVPGA